MPRYEHKCGDESEEEKGELRDCFDDCSEDEGLKGGYWVPRGYGGTI